MCAAHSKASETVISPGTHLLSKMNIFLSLSFIFPFRSFLHFVWLHCIVNVKRVSATFVLVRSVYPVRTSVGIYPEREKERGKVKTLQFRCRLFLQSILSLFAKHFSFRMFRFTKEECRCTVVNVRLRGKRRVFSIPNI